MYHLETKNKYIMSTVNGNETVIGDLTVNQNLTVSGNTIITGNFGGNITHTGDFITQSMSVAGTITGEGFVTFNNPTDANFVNTAAVEIEGGVHIKKRQKIFDTTASTSGTSGALVVSGGVGIGGNTNISGALAVSGGLGIQGNTNISGNLTGSGSLSIAGSSNLGNGVSINSAYPVSPSVGFGYIMDYVHPQTRCYLGDGTGYSMAFKRRANSIDTDLLVIRDNGNIGIGTAVPSEKLDVEGNTNINGKLLLKGPVAGVGIDTATNDRYADMRVIRNPFTDKTLYLNLGAGADSVTKLYSNNGETVTLKSGKLGINNNDPSKAVQLGTGGALSIDNTGLGYSSLGTKDDIESLDNSGIIAFGAQFPNIGGGGAINAVPGTMWYRATVAGDHVFFVDSDARIMTIANTGFVGIGIEVPTAKLDVVGNAKISGSLTTGSITINNSGIFENGGYLNIDPNTPGGVNGVRIYDNLLVTGNITANSFTTASLTNTGDLTIAGNLTVSKVGVNSCVFGDSTTASAHSIVLKSASGIFDLGIAQTAGNFFSNAGAGTSIIRSTEGICIGSGSNAAALAIDTANNVELTGNLNVKGQCLALNRTIKVFNGAGINLSPLNLFAGVIYRTNFETNAFMYDTLPSAAAFTAAGLKVNTCFEFTIFNETPYPLVMNCGANTARVSGINTTDTQFTIDAQNGRRLLFSYYNKVNVGEIWRYRYI